MKKLITLFILSWSTQIFAKIGHVSFIENKNQWQSQIEFKADLPSGAVFLTKDKFVYNFYSMQDVESTHEFKHHLKNKDDNSYLNRKVKFHAYEINFLNCNKAVSFQKNKKRKAYNNYFLGNDNSKWTGNVGLYENIVYENLYDGINLSVYSQENFFKYDFIVNPNANANHLQLEFKGVAPSLKRNGDLAIKTSINEMTELAPYAYQIIEGKEVKVPCNFVLKNGIVSYSFPLGYNHSLPLIIDPTMIYKTYSGSTATTYGWSATYDLQGNLYSGGECFATGWPVTLGAFQTTYGGSVDASINAYDPMGANLLHSTYFGGSDFDVPNSLVTTANGELIICGTTSSSNIPTTAGCYNSNNAGGQDIYVAHFNASCTALLGGTYIGGSNADGANNHEVNLDNNGDIIVASNTSSSNFPTTAGAYQTVFQGNIQGIFFKMNLTCSSLIFSSFLGGNDENYCKSIKQNNAGNYVVGGYTSSLNFPTTAGTLHTSYQGGSWLGDGFCSVFNTTATTLIASTYLGTTDDDGVYRIQIDDNDDIFVCGTSDLYPIFGTVYSNPGGNIFIDKLNSSLTTSLLSTRIGSLSATSSSFLSPAAFLLDNCDNIYVSCLGASSNLPLSANAYQTTVGGFWLCVLNPNLASLYYATYMGAIGDHIDGGSSRFDPQGIVYQSVCSPSTTAYQFPTSYAPNKQTTSYDVASFKFDFEAAGVSSNAAVANNDSVCAPGIIYFTNNSVNATSYLWDFGDGNTDTLTNPSHQYTVAGTYTVTLYANNPTSCITDDTSTLVVHIFDLQPPQIIIHDTFFCDPNLPYQIEAQIANPFSDRKIVWTPAGGIVSGQGTLTPIVNTSVTNTFTLTVTDSIGAICKETSIGIIQVGFGDTTTFKVHPVDTTVCPGETVTINASGAYKYLWSPTNLITDVTQASVDINVYSEIYYAVAMEDQYGCKATKHVRVDVFPKLRIDAGPEDVVRYGESIMLHASGGKNLTWLPNPTLSNINIANPMASPLSTTMYYVDGFDWNGCKATDSVKIHVANAIVPNAFTPNGDGLNDVFRFRLSSEFALLKSFRLFDRWGKELFYTDEAQKGWDGKYKGENCEAGVYFYLIEYAIGGKPYEFKGDVTLIR